MEAQQAKIAAKDMSVSIKEIVNSMEGKKATPQLKTSPQSYGKLQSYMDWYNNYIANCQNDYSNLNKAIEQEQIETIFTPATLNNHDKIIMAKSKLQRINRLYDEYETHIGEKTIEARIQVSNLEMEDSLKKEVLTGFDKGVKRRDLLFKEYFRIEREFLAETDNLLNFLLSRKGKYKYKNGKVMFYETSDVEQYKKHFQKIDNIIKEESTWNDKYRDKFLSFSKKLDEISNK
jgi:hypothetical protein